MSESIPSHIVATMSENLARLSMATRLQVAATLTAAMVAKFSTGISPEQMIEIQGDFYFSLFPEPGNPAYKEWLKTKNIRMRSVVG